MSFTYCIDNFSPVDLVSRQTAISGWIVAPFDLKRIIFLCPGVGSFPIEIDQNRPDVATALSLPESSVKCGFNSILPIPFEGPRNFEVIIEGVSLNLEPNDWITTFRTSQNSPLTLGHDSESGYFVLDLETKLKRVLDTRPSITIRLDIINKCNLRCIMCHYSDSSYFKRKAKRISLDEFRRFFESVGPMVKDIMLSCSDEPLLSPEFLQIVEYIANEFPHVEIEFCTNAMLLNEKVRRGIIRFGVTHLMCSLDAATKRTLESIRIGSNYGKIISNILALRDLKELSGSTFPKIISNFVMMDQNIHEAPVFVEMCSRMGIGEIDFRHVVPGDYWNDPSQFLQNHPEKFNFYRDAIIQKAELEGVKIHIPEPLKTVDKCYSAEDPFVSMDDFEAVKPDRCTIKEPVSPKEFNSDFIPRNVQGTAAHIFKDTYCTRPFSEISIFDQEVIRPCPHHRVTLGKQSDNKPLSEVFWGDEFRKLRKNMFNPNGDVNCQGCPIKEKYFGE